MAKVGKFCLAKRVKVEWLFHAKEIACIDKKEFSPIDIFSRKEAILKAYYTAYNKLCNWIDIDTTNVSKASNVTIICMLKKNFIINICCVEK